jgi:trk system potassium uptake protein TrkH
MSKRPAPARPKNDARPGQPDPTDRLAPRIREGWALARRRAKQPRPLQRTLRLIGGLAILVACGTLLLMLPISGAGRSLQPDEALFTAVSALSTTGLSVITPGRDLSRFGQVVLLLLMQIGGIGFMVGAVVVFGLLGRRITLEERLTLRDSLGLISMGSLLRLTRSVLLGVLIIESAGALLLWLNWLPLYGAGSAAFYAIFHAVSAFSNASFDLFSGTPDAPAAFPTDAPTLLILSTLVILGSIGIPVLADLARWPRRRCLSLHTRLTLVAAGTLLTLGTLALFVGESRPGVLFSDLPWPRQLLLAYFHSATSRTAGFVLQPLETMAPASVLTLMALMFVGGSPASMGGGITTSTLIVLVLAMWTYAHGRPQVTVGGRTIPTATVLKAAAILTISLLGVVLIAWLLLLTQRASFSDALFETVSAFATCGFTLGLTPRLDLFGRLLIALMMFWGRLGALTIVVVVARRGRTESISYPEEQILIG